MRASADGSADEGQKFSFLAIYSYQTARAHPDDRQRSRGYEQRRLESASGIRVPNQPPFPTLYSECFEICFQREGRQKSYVVGSHPHVDGTDAKMGFFFSSRRRHTRSLRDWSSD